MNRNLSLDLLKILSCFSVVVLHVSGSVLKVESSYTVSHALYYAACIAVPIFFMVNGYLLLNKKELSYKYIFKKIINILVIVFCWNLLIYVPMLFIGETINNPIYSSIESLMQIGYFYQFWFFGSLIIIYLFVPIINKSFKNIKKAILLTFTMISICLVIDLISIFRSMKGESIVQINVIQTFRLWTWFAYYLLGGLLGNVTIRNKIISYINIKWNYFILIIALISSNLYQYNMAKLYNTFNAEYFYDNILTFIYVISLFILILRFNFEKAKNFVAFIGSNMIGIYILHITIIKVLGKLIEFNKPFINILMILVVFLTSLLSSWIISKIPLIKKLISL